MARFAFVAVAMGMIGAAKALEVITPTSDDVVVADRTYTVEWTGGGSDNRFEIDLYYCGSVCMEDDCGEWVTALCPYAADGCPDSGGDYDVVMPEPLDGVSSSGYKVRVMDVNDESGVDCSGDFYLLASEEAPGVGDADGPYLMVTSPSDGDVAVAGNEYTVEWDYDNGVGSKVDRFSLSLYKADGGSGDCGTYYADLCDKPSIGCKDSMGDYDVEIPEDTPAGMYHIRVGRFDDDTLYDCSDEFEVTSDDGDDDSDGDDDGSLSYMF